VKYERKKASDGNNFVSKRIRKKERKRWQPRKPSGFFLKGSEEAKNREGRRE
jgi:hypothetical protein